MTTPAKPRDPGTGQKQRGPAPPPRPSWWNWAVVIGLLLSLFLLFYPGGRSSGTDLTYSQFLAKEILRLHHGEIHAGPGMEGTEILISVRAP